MAIVLRTETGVVHGTLALGDPMPTNSSHRSTKRQVLVDSELIDTQFRPTYGDPMHDPRWYHKPALVVSLYRTNATPQLASVGITEGVKRKYQLASVDNTERT